ncbi:MAG: response regulator [Chloroflexi bacterium]|nr:response regulator [Chloroflexota bacterium]MCC6894877.1 response regulator [Anaerolineae bacterium]
MNSPIPRALEGWRVMVVDDEPDSLEIAKRLLQMAGAEVITAGGGQEALNIVRSARPQLIISDLSMPEVDGWTLLEKLKLERDTLEIPVIALTAHTMPGDRERAIVAGFHNHISKPLDPRRFISQLMHIVVDIPELKSQLTAVI